MTLRRAVLLLLFVVVPVGRPLTATPPVAVETVVADDGIRLHARRVGEGPVRLIVPGGFLGLEDTGWMPSSGATVFYDMRNRGRSEAVPEDGALTLEADVADLEAVRRHFAADRVSLVGYSYLGLMVALYGAEHPERVDRMVQLGSIPRKFGTAYPPALTYADDAWTKYGARAAELAGRSEREICEGTWEALANAMVGDPARASRLGPARCEWPNEWPTAFGRHIERHFLGSVMKADPAREQFYRVTAPVLVVHGTKDRNAPYGGGREWALTFPNARLLTVDGAAHAAWAEDDRAARDIVTFLQGAWPESAEPVRSLDPAEDVEGILARGRAAIAESQWAQALQEYREAALLLPAYPAVLLRVAEVAARAGAIEEGLAALERGAAYGVATLLETLDAAFAPVASQERYLRERSRLDEARRPQVASRTAFQLADREILPESVAWDAERRVWYVGSMYQRKVLRVDETGRATDLVPEGRDGLWGVLGIKFDAARRELWALSYNGASPPMRTPDPASAGHGALYRWHVDDGRLLARYEAPFQPLGMNDLVLAPGGDVYMTCETRVCVLRAGAARVEVFSEHLGFLNGIAIADDGSRLYVASHRRGILVLDVETRASTPLELPADESLAGVDGLMVRGQTLVAIQNAAGAVERVLQGRLDVAGTRLENLVVLERAHPAWDVPTTGVLVGNELHYVGVSNLASFRARAAGERAELPPSVIYRVPLR